jgi:hypothetical protein|tara:strand:+ start:159 stop:314 length:156 start_codon:yes stop_codon:yes gene_type:complete
MKKGYVGCEHTSETYLQVAREMREERARLFRRLTGNQNLQDVIRTKRGKRK